jgi:hypothetical protein
MTEVHKIGVSLAMTSNHHEVLQALSPYMPASAP